MNVIGLVQSDIILKPQKVLHDITKLYSAHKSHIKNKLVNMLKKKKEWAKVHKENINKQSKIMIY